MRIGTGYDVHRLVEGRKLIMGGVDIPYEKGLLGHSDADVLSHAIMDALLGAAALGDIGKFFPDTDPKYKGADSLMLMREVGRILEEHHYLIGNVDATILAGPILIPCGRRSRTPCRSISLRSASRRRQRKDWALPAPERALPSRRSP